MAEPKALRYDRPTKVYLALLLTGVVVCIVDFVFLQALAFNVFFIAGGLVLWVFSRYFSLKGRKALTDKAGFPQMSLTGKLGIVEGHKLVTDGIYTHIRHPIYLGEIFRLAGTALFFSSIYGGIIMAAAIPFLFYRIGMEERMLIEAFDNEYIEYQKRTKKIIPYIY
jgi:protein-S-isoprenylcysteine O-methyltransferase Ste14